MEGSLDYDAIPDPLVYYTGSRIRVEWTNQHACGQNPNSICQMVVQYACHDPEEEDIHSLNWMQGLRDGYPMAATVESSDDTYDGYLRRRFLAQTIPGTGTAQNQQGTTRIPDNAFNGDETTRNNFYYRGTNGGMEFGMHEGIKWYDTCRNTIRNKGLYISDQNVNKNDARATRQNPNGNRNGLECPEERDYWPYWRPTPWRDVAVLTSNTTWCQYFKDHSQNVVPVGWCSCDATCKGNAENNLIPITEATCDAAGGEWMIREKLGGGAPECMYHGWGRDNHLGNVAPVDADGNIQAEKHQPETAHYNWIVPKEAEDKHCVLRLRYNISTTDYEWHGHAAKDVDDRYIHDNSHSCRGLRANRNEDKFVRIAQGLPRDEDLTGQKPQCMGILNATHRPIFERPYVAVFPHLVNQPGTPRTLALAINTDQTSRTFQDRTHVFKVSRRPSGVSGRIFNLNVRGRRGNIVQAYPSVEYDFVPNKLEVTEDDWVHIQIHGSDFNDDKNANNGEGWRYSDRHNMVEMSDAGSNYPKSLDEIRMFSDEDAEFFALLDQSNCADYYYNGNDNERTRVQNQADNCAQLNRAPNRFPQLPADGLVLFREGNYRYASTRDNNFSNRSHKAQLIVGEGDQGLSAGEKAAVAVGVIAAAGAIVGGVLVYGKRKPDSAVGGCFRSTAACVTCQNSGAAASTSTQAPSMEYTRH